MFDAESSYLIAGGLGGLGRSAARWMARRGAKNLVLLSRSGVRAEASIALVEDLKSMGVHVIAPACDVTDPKSLSAVITECTRTIPPIKGVIQASMVLKVCPLTRQNLCSLFILKHFQDGMLENMTIDNWKASIKPKVQGSWNLHTLLPHGMDFFICLSSISGIVGRGGQANYAAGNTYMDALVRYRLTQGEKATSIDLGWMMSEGVVAENEHLSTGIAGSGDLIPITPEVFHALLDYYCNPALELESADSYQAVIGLEVPAAMLEKGLTEPAWMQRRTFRHLRQIGLDASSTSLSGRTADYAALLREATSLGDAARIVTDGLVQRLSRALSIPPEDIDTSKPLHVYGVDSLLAVELRNYFAKELSADVPIFDITGGASFEVVGLTVARKSHFCPAALKVSEG